MTKVDLNFDATSVSVEGGNSYEVNINLRDVDLSEVVESAGKIKILEEIGVDFISDYLRDLGYKVEDEEVEI